MVRPKKAKKRRFNMIRDFALADLLTLGNGFSGMGVVLASMEYLASGSVRALYTAFGLVPLALALDVLDGSVARWRGKSSPLGQDLDSLADVVSFGVAPAALAYALGLRAPLDVVFLLYFVGCGISRLARFNVTVTELTGDNGKVRYFEGTPIPSSVLLVLVLFVLWQQGKTGDALPFGTIGDGALHPLSLLWFLSGSAMISKNLRIPKP